MSLFPKMSDFTHRMYFLYLNYNNSLKQKQLDFSSLLMSIKRYVIGRAANKKWGLGKSYIKVHYLFS